MFLKGAGKHQDIVNVDYHKYSEVGAKNTFHSVLEETWTVCQTHGGHRKVLLSTVWGDKACFPGILRVNGLLEKPFFDIHGRKYGRAAQCHQNLILFGEWICIRFEFGVNSAKVNHHTGFAVFPDHKSWGGGG